MEKITNMRQSFVNATAEVRQALAIQFEPLVNKIVAQQSKILKADWDTLKSMGYEGLVIAMNTYDPERSKMTFTQFAAYAILNNIHNCSCTELHTVKLTSYTQEQIKNDGGSTFVTTSISAVTSPDGSENCNREMRYGVYETAKFADGDVMELLHTSLTSKFNETDCYCFFSYFGICGAAEKKVNELAKEMNVTSGRISQRINKIVRYIKTDENLCEALASLMAL